MAAAAQEGPGRPLEVRPLPRLEDERALMLLAGAMLREEAPEVPVVRRDDGRGGAAESRTNAIRGQAAAQQRGRRGDDPRVLRVEE
jgi:hypothetical protein